MGSDSDLPVIEKAVRLLREFEIPFEVHIYSAHRTPVEARDFALHARENGFGVIIAAAGMAAHLAGAFAANTTLPVIGIPCKGPVFDGMDALLSTVQMPSGVPVATVGVNNGANAALLAAEILAVEDADLAALLQLKRQHDNNAVLEKDASIVDRLYEPHLRIKENQSWKESSFTPEKPRMYMHSTTVTICSSLKTTVPERMGYLTPVRIL